MNTEIKVKDLSNKYEAFDYNKEYCDGMPDIQNSPYAPTRPIERVGIQGFHMPLWVLERDGGVQEVVAHITGTVSLEADKAGINMSRILRTAYKSCDDVLSIDQLCKVLENYRTDLDSFDAHITMSFPYRYWQDAPASKKEDGTPEGGWQYYDVVFDVDLNRYGIFRKVMYLDFIYSSACPCSTALSQHAAYTRGVYGIPHSQRSVARLGIEFDQMIWIEDLIDACRKALTTEVLVFCKRQDEMDFALKNGAQPKFVEDAVRILADMLENMADVKDYRVVCSHNESLHAHNAIALISKGLPGSNFSSDISIEEYQSMLK